MGGGWAASRTSSGAWDEVSDVAQKKDYVSVVRLYVLNRSAGLILL